MKYIEKSSDTDYGVKYLADSMLKLYIHNQAAIFAVAAIDASVRVMRKERKISVIESLDIIKEILEEIKQSLD